MKFKNLPTGHKVWAAVLIFWAIALVVWLLVLTLPSVKAEAMPADQPTARWMEHACDYEDQANCFWDAGLGNGKGHSFYVHVMDVRVGDQTYKRLVCLMYTDRNYAKTHDHCFSQQAARISTDIDGDGYGGETR